MNKNRLRQKSLSYNYYNTQEKLDVSRVLHTKTQSQQRMLSNSPLRNKREKGGERGGQGGTDYPAEKKWKILPLSHVNRRAKVMSV